MKFFNSIIFALLIIAFATTTCNKPFPNDLGQNNGNGNPTVVVQKTMVIVVDGAVGVQVQVANPPVLNSLVDYSIFSWDALNDYDNNTVTNPLAWANVFTGVKSNKHNIAGNDFTNNQLSTYPTIFTRIKQQRPAARTSAFCSSNIVANVLATDATLNKSFNEDDAAVKEAVKAELANQNSDLLLAQFSNVDKAGAASTYTINSQLYKDAILKIDSYIGEILTALKNRPTYKSENWMVIITSNKGSNTVYNSSNWSAFDDSRHNTFFFCYNPRFNSKNLQKPGSVIPYTSSAAPQFNGTQSQNRRAKVVSGSTLYDIGTTGEMTVQCKIKVPSGSYNYPAFLSKRASFTAGVVGWVLFMESNYWQINIGQSALGNRQIRGNVISDGQWHTVTAVIRKEGTARNVYTYTDGVPYTTGITAATRDITSYGNLNSPQPLTVGNLPPDNVTGLGNFFITDIRYYNVALPDSYIASTYCMTSLDPASPYSNNLVGFWPGYPVVQQNGAFTMLDMTTNGRHFVFDSYSPGSFNDLSSLICPPITADVYKTVPNSVDIASQVYQWLGLSVPTSWDLDGKNWVPTYSDVSGG